NQVLRAPRKLQYRPDQDLRRRVSIYFQQVLGGRRTEFAAKLPEVMPLWGKVRVRGGDAMRTSFAIQRLRQESRDNTFVRYEVTYHGEKGQAITAIRYGQLEKILVCELGTQALWRDMKASTQILAVIRPCRTTGEAASQKLVEFRNFHEPIVTDLRSIKSVVGRVKTRGRWGIVDRSDGSARAVFQALGDVYGAKSDSEGEGSDVGGDGDAESEEE
ncbi:hypothetical protein PAXRUDRAFT_830475, partial [Paxillus rubicundulus Ve08.2h10]